MSSTVCPARSEPEPPSRSPSPHTPENDDDEDFVGATHHSPLRMELAGLRQTTHTRTSVHPYLEQDLKDSEVVGIYPWVEAVFGVPRNRLDEWTSKIGTLNWFDDEIIQECLHDFCDAVQEKKRYAPFCKLANRIIALARGKLPHVRANSSYPVDTITFIDTPKRAVSKIPEHGALGADRFLDVTVTHGSAYTAFMNGQHIEWSDIFHSVELKQVRELSDVLAEEIRSRAAATTQSNEVKTTQSRPTQVNRRKPKIAIGRRKRRPPKSTSKKIPAPSKILDEAQSALESNVKSGSKREREGFDIMAGFNLSSDPTSRTLQNLRIEKGKEAALQAGSYALELLSCTYGSRVSCHSSILEDDLLTLMYYDACGIVYTVQRLSLIHDFEKTAAIIVALASCTPERFGALPASFVKPPKPYNKFFPPHDLSGAVVRFKHPVSGKQARITLQSPLYAQYVLAGRRTFAYTTKASPKASEERLMVKFSYQVVTRKPEYDLINMARKARVKHLPRVHMWADLWRMSDGARGAFYGDDPQCAKYEDRTLRMIVYTEYGSIKSLFSQRCDLMPVMVNQMVKCLHDLRYHANMLHRDISVDNIMYRMWRGKYCFILNDFDMAVVLNKDDGSPYTPSSKHRTGTLPFMAVSLVRDAYLLKTVLGWTPCKHLLRHDYESLFWVCLWCVLVLFMDSVPSATRKAYRATLRKWEGSDLQSIQGVKLALSTLPLNKSGITLPPQALCLEKWFKSWVPLFLRLHTETSEDASETPNMVPGSSGSAAYDEDTAGGIMSMDNLLKVLTPLMPLRQDEDDSEEDDEEPLIPKVPAVVLKSKSRSKSISAEALAVKASILSRLRPRKAGKS
ncbi:hypothetical protein EIP86_006692 [Pleurotus ostreatoroseus]|nr:hypothetical protein EIP86_006692 [Pleurotus ostreatoroseus]